MTVRVHGGVYNDSWLTGSLRYFSITGVDFSGYKSASDQTITLPAGATSGDAGSVDVDFKTGEIVPDSAAEMVYEIISRRSTPVIWHIDSTGVLHFALENTAAGYIAEYENAAANKGVPADKTLASGGEAVEVLKADIDSGQTAFVNSDRNTAGLTGLGYDDIDVSGSGEVVEVPFILNTSHADVINTTAS